MNPIQLYMRLRDVSQYRATVELANGLNVVSKDKVALISDETGEMPESDGQRPCKPSWDAATNTLKLGDTAIRTIKRPKVAKNIISILNAFEKQGWPERIEDPLPKGPDLVRLAAAVRSLHRNLKQIGFSKDGTGAGIKWKRV